MEIGNKKEKIVAVSGGFDPIHIGHIRLFKEAKKLGTKLVVMLNNDNWLKKKKGSVFMSQDERKEIIEALEYIDSVILTEHEKDPKDMSVCAELKKIRPDIFANGGDRKKNNIPEVGVCREIKCRMIFNVGHSGKIQSSSWLLSKYADGLRSKNLRPWGYFVVIEEGKNFKVKKVFIEPKKKISLQLHKKRAEHWVVLKGRARINLNGEIFNLKINQSIDIPIMAKHRLENPDLFEPLEIIEVQSGNYLSEDDIIRFDDDYGRV